MKVDDQIPESASSLLAMAAAAKLERMLIIGEEKAPQPPFESDTGS
jgi:hypothetical protein